MPGFVGGPDLRWWWTWPWWRTPVWDAATDSVSDTLAKAREARALRCEFVRVDEYGLRVMTAAALRYPVVWC